MEDKLNELRQRFLERCGTNLPLLRAGYSIGEAAPVGEQADFLRLIHSLAGSGGMFGFPAISNAAMELETVLQENGGQTNEDMVKTLLDGLIAAMNDALETRQDVGKS
ncbi:Hpt domain-containing protein [Phyllobacterium sp. A18/5-2]|jgi:HPt (histidine-containing phosphotransfer) domain-containing protein|uniref:Hpt domain-containing protein n=1 Tax=Phyllobacterium sp. A18/5-2 TaxID=2978392 RepID=UPI000DD65E07|nr:Hpt domain-containing protein [Phyllobacterium sp. A18/5-2]UXN63705.1 Hpt domain-containing protein [Phyllobacterium sp. A18/5-2]